MAKKTLATTTLVGLILVLTFLARAVSSMMQANNPLLAHDLGAQLGAVGLVTSVYAVATLLTRFGYSARIPLSKVPRAMTVGFVLLVGALGALLAVRSFVELLLAVIFSGVATALIMPHLLSLMGAVASPEERDHYLSYYSLALSSSLVVAPVLGTLLLLRFPLRDLYAMLLGFAGLALLAMVRYERALARRLGLGAAGEPSARPRLMQVMRELAQNRVYANSYGVLFLFNWSFAAALSFGGIDVRDRFHLPYVWVEMILTSFFVVSLLGRVVISRQARSGGLTKKATWIFWALATGALGLALMGWGANLALFLAGFWLLAWPHAVVFPLVSMRVAASVDKSQLVAANTLVQSSFDLSGTVGPLTLGVIAANSSLGVAFWLVAVLQMVAMGVVFFEAREERAFQAGHADLTG